MTASMVDNNTLQTYSFIAFRFHFFLDVVVGFGVVGVGRDAGDVGGSEGIGTVQGVVYRFLLLERRLMEAGEFESWVWGVRVMGDWVSCVLVPRLWIIVYEGSCNQTIWIRYHR